MFPPTTTYRLDGWELRWFRLSPTAEGERELARLASETVSWARERFADGDVVAHPAVGAVRRLFRAAGCDPTRYRPSSEALLRRVLKTGGLPAISPLVDVNNLLSLRLMLPCCVVDAAAVAPPFELRVGAPDEAMESLRGRFNLGGKPVLTDQRGPFGTPITDARRVMITEASTEAWLVAYLARELGLGVESCTVLNEFLALAPVAELLGVS